jgi:hypothetical protein
MHSPYPTKHQKKSLLMAGSRLTRDEALQLEQSVDGFEDRIKIIGFYNHKIDTEHETAHSAIAELYPHLAWLVRHYPDADLMQEVNVPGYALLDRDQCFELYKVWLDVLDEHPHTAPLLFSALRFLRIIDRDHELQQRLSVELEVLQQSEKPTPE